MRDETSSLIQINKIMENMMKPLFLVIFLVFSLESFAQISSETNYLRFSAFNNDGEVISELKPDMVTLKTNGEIRKVKELVSEKDEPAAVAILLRAGSFAPIRATMALKYIQKANSKNDYCIIDISTEAKVIADWKSTDDKLVSSLNKVAASKTKPEDGIVFDATALALKKLQESPLKKKVLLIMDIFYSDISRRELLQLIDLVKESDAIIYGVKIILDSYSNYDRDENIEKISDSSGGRVYFLYIESGMEYAFPSNPIGRIIESERRPKIVKRSIENESQKFAEMLVIRIETTYLLAYESQPNDKSEKIKVIAETTDKKGKKIKVEVAVKKISKP